MNSNLPTMVEPLFVNRETAARILSLSIATFMLHVRLGTIPKGRLVTPGRVGWLYAELVSYAKSRPESDLLPPPNTGNRKGKKAANDEQPFNQKRAATCPG